MNEPTFSDPTPGPTPEPAAEAPRRADALPRGTVIAGCEIGRVVADSSFSIVYHARDPATERRYAIKEYLPVSLALRSDDGRSVALRAPEHAEAFERGLLAFAAEAELLEHRTHPSLLRVLRTWRGQGSIYRVMPWIDGESLLTLRRGLAEPPDEATVRRLVFGLLGALQALHDGGHVHGAVSPGHVMVLPDDRPMLMDTGAVARALVGDQTRALMALVSPGFAAPAGSTAGGPAADLRAVAAVAHFAISGEVPAAGAAPSPLSMALRRLRLPLGRPTYSASLLDTIDAALAGDPKHQFGSATEFRAALTGQAELPPGAAPAARAEPTLDVSQPYIAAAATGIRENGPADPARGYRARRADTQHRRARLITWLGAGAFATLVASTATVVYFQQQASSELRTDAITRPIDVLPAPAAAMPGDPGPAPTAATAPRVKPVPEPAPTPEPAAAPAPAQVPTPEPLPTLAPPPPPPPSLPPPAARVEPAPVAPKRTEREAAKPAATAAALPRGPASPREVCGARTEFALYRCMSTECARPAWFKHAQCQRLRDTDMVD